jgi:hypothetical protein
MSFQYFIHIRLNRYQHSAEKFFLDSQQTDTTSINSDDFECNEPQCMASTHHRMLDPDNNMRGDITLDIQVHHVLHDEKG